MAGQTKSNENMRPLIEALKETDASIVALTEAIVKHADEEQLRAVREMSDAMVRTIGPWLDRGVPVLGITVATLILAHGNIDVIIKGLDHGDEGESESGTESAADTQSEPDTGADPAGEGV